MTAVSLARGLLRRFGVDAVRYRPAPPDFLPADVALLQAVRPYTMTSAERIYAAANAARYVADAKIPGAVVECGVWRGGSTMAMAMALIQRGVTDRDIYLFDTYEGMSAPTEEDRDHAGRPAAETFEATKRSPDSSDWCYASIEDVQANVTGTGYPAERLHFVKGKVEDTIPGSAPDEIALLRLDTDWYESTRHELEHLWPRLVPGGVCIVDDYGHWAGSRKAVDEYLEAHGLVVLMHRIDDTGRVIVKP